MHQRGLRVPMTLCNMCEMPDGDEPTRYVVTLQPQIISNPVTTSVKIQQAITTVLAATRAISV